MSRELSAALTVAGSDSGGGAGIQADLLTFAAHGVFGLTAITCLTAQNPSGVSGVEAVPAEFVLSQIRQVSAYFRIGAWKTGMLFNASIIGAVAAHARAAGTPPLVCDPVMVASSGASLLHPDAVEAVKELLLPAAFLITPNLDEAAVLLGQRPRDASDLPDAARELVRRFGTSVLLKGGHLDGGLITDTLCQRDGSLTNYQGARIPGVDTHGSGCTLSAAITARLARGETLETAVAGARDYLRRGMESPLRVAGKSFISHGT